MRHSACGCNRKNKSRSCLALFSTTAWGFGFPLFAEGSLPKHVLADFPRYLASVYEVLVNWLERIEAGAMRIFDSRDRFCG